MTTNAKKNANWSECVWNVKLEHTFPNSGGLASLQMFRLEKTITQSTIEFSFMSEFPNNFVREWSCSRHALGLSNGFHIFQATKQTQINNKTKRMFRCHKSRLWTCFGTTVKTTAAPLYPILLSPTQTHDLVLSCPLRSRRSSFVCL